MTKNNKVAMHLKHGKENYMKIEDLKAFLLQHLEKHHYKLNTLEQWMLVFKDSSKTKIIKALAYKTPQEIERLLRIRNTLLSVTICKTHKQEELLEKVYSILSSYEEV